MLEMGDIDEKLLDIEEQQSRDPQLVDLRRKLVAADEELNGENGKKKLTTILELKESSRFTPRILEFFFSNPSQGGKKFDVETVMEWIEALVGTGSYEHKAHFLYFLYDLNGEGSMTKKDIENVVNIIVRENGLQFKPASAEILADSIFYEFVDHFDGGVLLEKDFALFCQGWPFVLDTLTIGKLQNHNWKKSLATFQSFDDEGSYTLGVNHSEALSAFQGQNIHSDRRQMHLSKRARFKWELEGDKYIIIALWLTVTALMMAFEFNNYNTELNYELSGYSIPVAKMGGAALRLNCHLLLIPVCKKLLTQIRDFMSELSMMNALRWKSDYRRKHGPTWLWDKHVSFHKLIACSVAVFTAIHVGGHLYNAIQLSRAPDELFMHPSYGWCCGEGTYFREYSFLTSKPTVAHIIFLSVPGWTGCLQLLIFAIMFFFARGKKRRENYERFLHTHYLLVFWYALLMLHGTSEIVAEPRFWKWSSAFLSMYIINWILRYLSRQKATVKSAEIGSKSKWISLRLTTEKPFRYKTGAYALLAVPEISRVQYHPFTISSGENQSANTVSFHIKADGDWTNNLQYRLRKKPYPTFVIEGPYSSAAQHVFEYDICLLFCTGVGVTPFASILDTIKNQPSKGQSIHFYWSSRDQFSFDWFSDLFGSLLSGKNSQLARFQPVEKFSHAQYSTDHCKLNLFMTGTVHEYDVTNALLRMCLESVYERTNIDLITGIQNSGKTSFGRPNMEAIFEEMIDKYPGKEIGVFVCGTSAMCSGVHELVMSKTGKRSTVFRYYKEVF